MIETLLLKHPVSTIDFRPGQALPQLSRFDPQPTVLMENSLAPPTANNSDLRQCNNPIIVYYLTSINDWYRPMSIMKKLVVSLFCISILCLISACTPDKQSGTGLYLPKGNIDNGKQAFIDLGCTWCHSVKGIELPALADEPPPFNIQLGGQVFRVKTYGELVTSIINPDHVISSQNRQILEKLATDKNTQVKSLMPSFNDRMTVTELVDLVTFLDSHYEKYIPEYSARDSYPIY